MSNPTDANPFSEAQLEEWVFQCLESSAPAVRARELAGDNRQLERDLLAMLDYLQVEGVVDTVEPAVLPESIGHYHLVRRLGEGGMGMVYLAQDRNLHRRVALKIVRPELVHFATSRLRFDAEVAAIARLSHPGIVSVYEAGDADGMPYLAMEFVEGRGLDEVLRGLAHRQAANLNGKDLFDLELKASGTDLRAELVTASWVDACVRVARDVAAALTHAHECGVLHRDCKPSNVMLDVTGRVRLLDFGLAHADDRQQLTRSGAVLGSLPYMAPEQVRGERTSIDQRVDVYSLGVTLYELLTLHSPFLDEDSAEQTRENVLRGRAAPIRHANPKVPADVAIVVGRAMAVEPDQRYQTAADFHADLDNLLARRSIHARKPDVALRVRRLSQRHPALALAVLVAVCLVSIGGFVLAAFEKDARLESEQLRRDSERSLYAASIAAGFEAIRSHHVAAAEAHLNAAPEALRGWEWWHLKNRLDVSSETRKIGVPSTASVSMSTSGDRSKLAVLYAGELSVYESATMRRTFYRRLPGLPRKVVLAPGGERLAVLWHKAARRVWIIDLVKPDANPLIVKTGPRPEDLDFFPDGQSFVVALRHDQTQSFDVSTGALRWSRRMHGLVTKIACAPGQRTFALVGYRPAIGLYGEGSRKHLWLSPCKMGLATYVGFGRGGILACGSIDGRVHLRVASTGAPVGFPLVCPTSITTFDFHPTKEEVVVAAGPVLYRFNVRTGVRCGVMHGHRGQIFGVVYGAGGRTVHSVADDGTLKTWSSDANELPVLQANDKRIRGLDFHPNGQSFVCATRDRPMTVYGLHRMAPVEGRRLRRSWGSAAGFDPDGAWLAAANERDHTVVDVGRWKEVRSTKKKLFCGGATLSFTRDGLNVAIGTNRGEVDVLSRAQGWRRVTTVPVPGLVVRAIRQHPSAQRMVAVGDAHSGASNAPGGNLLVLDTTSWSVIGGRKFGEGLYSCAFHPNGESIAIAGEGAHRTIRILSFPGLQEVAQAQGHSGTVTGLRFTPDGTRLFSCSVDTSIRVWDTANFCEVTRLAGAGAAFHALALSPGGETLLAGDSCGRVIAWSASRDSAVRPQSHVTGQ